MTNDDEKYFNILLIGIVPTDSSKNLVQVNNIKSIDGDPMITGINNGSIINIKDREKNIPQDIFSSIAIEVVAGIIVWYTTKDLSYVTLVLIVLAILLILYHKNK